MAKLRFKNKNGSNYPSWEKKTIGNIGSVRNGYLFKSSTYAKGKYKVIGVTNVTGDKYIQIDDKTNTIKKLPDDIKPHQILKNGDILISLTGNVGRVSINNQPNCLLNQRVGLLDVALANPNYVAQYISRDKFRYTMENLGQGSSLKNITKEDIESYPINLPSKEEQQKIADFLTAYDDRIILQRQKIEFAEKRKRELLKRVFSQEIRFKDANGKEYPKWEEKTIAECCDCLDNMRKPIIKGNREAGKYPYYGAYDIQDYVKDYIFDEPLILLTEDAGPFDEFDTKPIAQFATGKYWVNNHTHVLRPHHNRAFFFYSIVHKDIRKYATISRINKLRSEQMYKIVVPIPCEEEQEKIANFFLAIDEQINIEKKRLESMVAIKKGLGQQLF